MVTEETTKPLLGQAEEKPQFDYLTSIADELLLPTEVVSRSTPSGPSEVSSSVVVDTLEVVAESGHSTPVVAAPVSEGGAECNCLPTFPWGPSGRTRSQKGQFNKRKVSCSMNFQRCEDKVDRSRTGCQSACTQQ